MARLLVHLFDAVLEWASTVPLSALLFSCAGSLLLAVACYYLVMPMDWVKDLSDVGFDSLRTRGRCKAAVVRETQRRRKIGNLPPVYPNGWFALCESHELKPGQVKHVTALGQNLAVFRGESGQVHVLDAYCPHMGANMAVGGQVRGDCLECPFHAWRFSGDDGKCVGVPYAEKVPDFARVRRWDSMECNGFVFVWHHAEGDEPSWTPQPVRPVEDGSWVYCGRNEFLVSCHIQEIPENGADVAHLNVVHGPGLVFPGLSRHVWAAQWAPNTQPGQQHTATMRLSHQFTILGKIKLIQMDVRAEQVGPGYVELYISTCLGPMVILQTVTPVEPLLQRIVHRMYCPTLMVPYGKFTMMGECYMFERDILVWNHKTFEDKPLLVKEDRLILRYRRWFSQFYSENSPKHSFRNVSLEW